MLLQRGGALSRNCRGCSPTMRLFPASANGGYHPAPVLHRPQPPPTTVDYFDKSTTGSTSTSVFLRKMFRNSAATPASPLIRKSTTLRSTLWCSHYSVAKRQQFSYPLGTASLSLKMENADPALKHVSVFLSIFLCFWRHVSRRLWRR